MSEDRRRSYRYSLAFSVDVMADARRLATGRLVDISESGCGFRTPNKLMVGARYTVSIDHIGQYDARVVRHFDCFYYGAEFLLSALDRARLAKRLHDIEVAKMAHSGPDATYLPIV